MSDTKEITAEQLVEVLKFTPRTYKISMWGYGGEKVMGTVDKKIWDYCMANQVDLQDIAWSYDVEEDMGLDPEMLPFPPGSWYECDDMAHVNGVSRNAGTVQIEDENGDTVYEHSLDSFDYDEPCPDLCCDDEIWIGMRAKGEVVFIGSSNEKGTFFEGEINLTAPFDIEKLELHYDEIDGEEIITSVCYDGEDIDNWGGSTDGKSSDFNMCLITDNDGNWERYEPEEKDWGHPEFGTSPGDWESSPKFKFKQHQPVYTGYYSVNWSYGSTFGSLYWDGENFGEWEYGKFKPVDQAGIVTWQGYNWDTSSWVNQPPAPPNVVCTNKKCGWVGDSSERIEDEEFNDHCPECNGTDFDWVDYDPDTKQGQKNREKYCREWDPVASLEKIVLELGEQIGADPEELAEIKQTGWPFGPADTTNAEVTESKSKWFTVKTYYKKSCEQHEYFTHDDYSGPLIVKDGFRFATYNVETNDGEFPKFEFTNCPGGSADLDSIDLNSCSGSNIETTELVEMFDGGCWGDTEFPDDMPEEEKERLEEFLSENGSYALEDDEGWCLDETEVWVWGPLEVTDDEGNTRIVCADEHGNMVDFVE